MHQLKQKFIPLTQFLSSVTSSIPDFAEVFCKFWTLRINKKGCISLNIVLQRTTVFIPVGLKFSLLIYVSPINFTLKILFPAYNLMMNSINRNLNIVAVLTKNKDQKQVFSQ